MAGPSYAALLFVYSSRLIQKATRQKVPRQPLSEINHHAGGDTLMRRPQKQCFVIPLGEYQSVIRAAAPSNGCRPCGLRVYWWWEQYPVSACVCVCVYPLQYPTDRSFRMRVHRFWTRNRVKWTKMDATGNQVPIHYGTHGLFTGKSQFKLEQD